MIVQSLRRLGWREACWLAAGLVLIVLMRQHLLSYEQKLAPVEVSAALKQRAVARDFAVTAKGFRLAHRYVTGGDSALVDETRTLQTPGIWLAVPVEVEMLQRQGYLSAQLRTRDGLVYRASGEGRPVLRGLNLSSRLLAPGFTRSGAYFFELPPDKVPGAHLQIYSGLLTPGANDSLVDIDLGTGGATPAELLAQAAEEINLKP